MDILLRDSGPIDEQVRLHVQSGIRIAQSGFKSLPRQRMNRSFEPGPRGCHRLAPSETQRCKIEIQRIPRPAMIASDWRRTPT
jgi:hypothetical protein